MGRVAVGSSGRVIQGLNSGMVSVWVKSVHVVGALLILFFNKFSKIRNYLFSIILT